MTIKEFRQKHKDLIEAPLEEQYGPKSNEELAEMKMPYEDYCKAAFAPGHEMSKPEALKGIRWMSTTMNIFTPIPSPTWRSWGRRFSSSRCPAWAIP